MLRNQGAELRSREVTKAVTKSVTRLRFTKELS